MLAVGGLPVFNVVVVKFYINCMVAINRCMIVLVLILIYTSLTVNYSYLRIIRLTWFYSITRHRTSLRFTFKFFTEVLFLSIILCLANTGIVNVLVSTLNSKPDEVTGYECGLYSTKGGRLKDRISFYTVGLTMMIFDVEVVLTFAFLLSLTFATTSSFLSVGIFVVILGLDLF